MSAQYQKSSYGNSSRSTTSNSSSGSKSGGYQSDNPTTHYAYSLIKNDDGTTSKEYLNSVLIYENEGKFGPFLKLLVRGPVPEGNLFIARKKGA